MADINPTRYLDIVNKNVYIGIRKCWVSDYNEVAQCSKGLSLEHKANKCEKSKVCWFCTSLDHIAKECPLKIVNGKPKCINCGGEHQSTSRVCPKVKNKVKILTQMTDYGYKDITKINNEQTDENSASKSR